MAANDGSDDVLGARRFAAAREAAGMGVIEGASARSSGDKTPPYGNKLDELRQELRGKSTDEKVLYAFAASQQAAQETAGNTAQLRTHVRHVEQLSKHVTALREDVHAVHASNVDLSQQIAANTAATRELAATVARLSSNMEEQRKAESVDGDRVQKLYEEILPSLFAVARMEQTMAHASTAIPLMAMAIRDVDQRLGYPPRGIDMRRASHQGDQTAEQLTALETGTGLCGLHGQDIANRKRERAEDRAELKRLAAELAKAIGWRAAAAGGATALITAPAWLEPLARSLATLDVTTTKGAISAALGMVVVLAIALVAIRRQRQAAGSVQTPCDPAPSPSLASGSSRPPSP